MSTFSDGRGAQTPRDIDGLAAWARGCVGGRAPEGTVAIVGAGAGVTNSREAFVDRAGAVQIIDALTAAVGAHDAREAAEARKLKRGDKVRGSLGGRFTVVSDEDSRGFVDVVSMRGGDLLMNTQAAALTRV